MTDKCERAVVQTRTRYSVLLVVISKHQKVQKEMRLKWKKPWPQRYDDGWHFPRVDGSTTALLSVTLQYHGFFLSSYHGVKVVANLHRLTVVATALV